MTRETSARALWLINGLTLLAAVIFLSPVLYSIWMSFQTSDAYYSGGVDFTLRNYDVDGRRAAPESFLVTVPSLH